MRREKGPARLCIGRPFLAIKDEHITLILTLTNKDKFDNLLIENTAEAHQQDCSTTQNGRITLTNKQQILTLTLTIPQ
jgi:hypothetical protein